MHMLERYGLTKLEVHRSEVFAVHEFLNQRLGDPQDIILSKTLVGFSDYVKVLLLNRTQKQIWLRRWKG
jgi:UDP-N-acetylglucosamine 2-epimerase (hydrolysing)